MTLTVFVNGLAATLSSEVGESPACDVPPVGPPDAAPAGGGAAASSSGGSTGGTSQSGLAPTSLLRVVANPLTKTVSVKLINALK